MIEKFLKDCLLEHQRATLPTFGTFYFQQSAASFSPGGNVLTPPHADIFFTENSSEQAPSLAEYIAEREGLPISQVAAQLDMFATHLREKLQEEGHAKLQGIGFFTQEEGTLRFQQLDEANVLPDSFGLPKIIATPIIDAPQQDTEEVEAYQKKQEVDTSQETFEKELQEVLQEERKQKWGWWLLPLLLAGAGVGAWMLFFREPTPTTPPTVAVVEETDPVEDSLSGDMTVMPLPSESQQADTPATRPEEVPAVAVVPAAKPQASKPAAQPAAKKPQAVSEDKAFIIIGSFGTRQNAETAVKLGRRQGYTSMRIFPHEGRFRVGIGFADNAAANQALEQQIRQQYKDAYLLK